jgi:hypothetical protein
MKRRRAMRSGLGLHVRTQEGHVSNMSGVSDDRKRHARSGDDERYKWVENEFCGKRSTFFPRRFDRIAFAGSKISKPLKKHRI